MSRLPAFLTLVALVSCSSTPNYFFETIDYISEVRPDISLKKGEMEIVDVDGIGLLDVKSLNDEIVISRTTDSEIISILDEKDFTVTSTFLNKGRGPNEILAPCFLSLCSLYDGKITIPDGQRVLSFVYDSAKVNNAIITSDIKELDFRPLSYIHCGNDLFFVRRWSSDLTHIERFIERGDVLEEPIWLYPLDKVSITKKHSAFDFNLVGAVLAYEPSNRMIAEACVYLNAINIYSLDGTFTKTICLGKKLDDIHKLENKDILNMNKSFLMVRAYKNGFSCLHEPDNRLYNFDWRGNLTYCIELPCKVSTFEFHGDYLYVLDRENESLARFKIPQECGDTLLK